MRRGRGDRDSGTNNAAADHDDDDDRHVDPEDRPPPDEFDQDTADQRPQPDAEARHPAPDTDRPSPVARFGEDVGDDRHRDGVEHRTTEGLQHPERDQPFQRRRDAAQQRSAPEDDQPGLKGAAPADPVGGRSGQQQKAGQDHDVGVDGPLQAGDRGAELLADRRQRHVDDRGVHADDEQAHAADAEHQKAPAGLHTATLAR